MNTHLKSFLTILLSFAVYTCVYSQGTYYDLISVSSPTFIADLQARIRSPYKQISYDSYDNTILANYESWYVDATHRAVQCIYSGEVYTYSPPFSWGYFSREHTWCQSWMPSSSGPQYSDQHHLFPTNQNNANGRRSNHPLDKVSSVTYSFLEGKLGTSSTGVTVYEPRDRHKGDSARALLYMALRYNGISGQDWTFSHLSSYLVANSEGPQSVEILKQWHEQDPPDKYEVDRNTYVQSTQLNRNPFVDHPEYVNYINFYSLSTLSPSFATEPANHLTNLVAGSINGDFIQLTWTDATGTPAPDGYLCLAYDTDNYFIPEDGIAYAEDSNMSDGKGIIHVNYAGGANNRIVNGLNPNTKYYFRMYPYTGSNASTNYKINGTIPSIVTTTIVGSLATEPSNHVLGFAVSMVTTNSMKVAWSNNTATQYPLGFLIIGNNVGTFSNPVDGIIYSDDTELGDGFAMVNTPYGALETSYNFTNLQGNQPYYYRIYPYNGTGSQRNYKTDGSIPETSGTTLPVPRLAEVITLDPISITDNSAVGDAVLVNLGYPVSTSYGFTWDTNTSPTIGLPTKTDNGTATTTGSFMNNITGLSNQTLYYLRGYATNSMGTFYGNEIQFYSLSPEPISHASNFTATAISQTQINLSWTTTAGVKGYLILQNQNSNPTAAPGDGIFYSPGENIGDGVVSAFVNSGTTSNQPITGLNPGTAYYFKIFPFDYDGVNLETYNYLTTGVVPFTSATTQAPTGPPVILNEFSQGASGAKEWVEILVVQNNFNLQNYKLIDGNGSLFITLSGPGYANLAQGTLIVLYNGGDIDTTITPDLNYNGTSDRSLQISSLNTTGSFSVTRGTGWNGTTGAFANGSNTDIPLLLSSTDTVFIFPRIPTPSSNNFTAYLGNTASGATISGNWSPDTTFNLSTPGQPNGGLNTIWINGLVPVTDWMMYGESDNSKSWHRNILFPNNNN